MKDLKNYNEIKKINSTMCGELSYSVYANNLAYETWFDAGGMPVAGLELSGMTYNFSTSLSEDFGTDENNSRQIVLKWDDQKTLFYKGLMVVGDEVMHVDTTEMSNRPSSYYGKIAIPVIDIDGKVIIKRGVNGTVATSHCAHSFCRSVINLTNSILDISYSDNAELTDSKPFSPVVSSGTIGIDIEPIEWGNKIINGEKNIYKAYELTNRIPFYCFVGTKSERICEFVSFSSSFNIMPTKNKVEVRISDKTSLYWNEEIKKSYQFMGANIIDVLSILFDYPKTMIRYPNSGYSDSDFIKISNVNTNKFKYYKDIMQEISKELMFRFSFDSNERIVIQSEVLKMKDPEAVKDILESNSFVELTDSNHIFGIEKATSSNILYNKLDTDIVEYKPFYDGAFFELSYDSADAVYPVENRIEALSLSKIIIENNESHRRFIYQKDSSTLYMAAFEYINDLGDQTYGLKKILVNNKPECTIEEARKYKSPIKYKFSKQLENVRILDKTIDTLELIFNTIVVKLPKYEAEMLDPYGKENGEYAILSDGINDFHARIIDISTADKDYFDVTMVFGFDKDYDFNFKGKTQFLSQFRTQNGFISYENKQKYVMYYVRKELPYVWQYSKKDKKANVNFALLGNDTFETWGNFGGIDTDDGKFCGLVDDIDNIYDNIYYPSYHNEYTQHSPIYMRSMMVGEYIKDNVNSMYISEFNSDLMVQILRSKPTEEFSKNSLITGMSAKNNNSSDLYIRITSFLSGSTIRINRDVILNGILFKKNTKFTTTPIRDLLLQSKISEEDVFQNYIVKVNGRIEKIMKEIAETVASDEKSAHKVVETYGKGISISSETYSKVRSGDILLISEPTEEEKKDPEILMVYHKYKDARWMVKSKTIDSDEYILFLDYEFPKKLNFDIVGGYVQGNPELSGYTLLQELGIKGNPILEYKQRYYYENTESVAKFGDKAYTDFSGKLMPSISDVNTAVSYIINSFSGVDENTQRSVIPIATSHFVGLDMLDTIKIVDRVYGTYDQLGILVGKEFSVSGNSQLKYNLKVFTIGEYNDSANGAIGSVSDYFPIDFPTFSYKDGDGGWESTGNQITKTDKRVGEVKFKRIDGSLFTATTVGTYYDSKEIVIRLKSPTKEEMTDKAFSEIIKAGSDMIIESNGIKHLFTLTKVNRESELVYGEIKIKNLFESNFDTQVVIADGEMLGLYQSITVIDEISSVIDRVDIIEKDTEENFGDDGVLGDKNPDRPLNFRLESAVNGFIVKLNHPDSKSVKGYNIYYRMIGRIVEDENGDTSLVPPEDNVERQMFTSATLTFVSAVGKRKYEVYMRSISHKGHLSDPTIILHIETRVLGFDDVYYPPGQSPEEQEEARKELAEKLGQQLDILEQADEYLRDKYGTITEDLEENYYNKTDTDTAFEIGFGKVEESVLDQTKKYTDTQFGITDGKINAAVEELNEKYTETGGEIEWAKAQLNMTKESISTLVKDVNIAIDGTNKKIDENYSEFIQTSEKIETVVGSLETRVDDAEITIKEETTKINQKADGIELVAKRTEAKVDKQALIGSNYIYNSGEFSTGKKTIKEGSDVEEVVKDEKNPLYWNNINAETAYPASVFEDTDGCKVMRIPHTEGVAHDGIYLPGGNVYYCSATVKMDLPFQSNSFEPINLWVSSVLDSKVEGNYGEDYELDILGTHIVETEDPDTGIMVPSEVPDEFPIIDNSKWTVIKIKLTIKGSEANKVRVVPRVKTMEPMAQSIILKNIQIRMGQEFKTWEPSLEQALDPINIVSMINITPDEIKLDSKLIRIGGGMVVEGENVTVNHLSAKRLQLGENFYYTEGDRDENNELIPDTERLIITKMNVGQIEAINPSLPSERQTIDQYIKGLDTEAKEEMRGELEGAKDLLQQSIDLVDAKAKESMESLKGMASDHVVTGQEKATIQTEYRELENRVKMLEESIRRRIIAEPLFGNINIRGLKEKIYNDTGSTSLNMYLINEVKLYEKYNDTNTSDPFKYDTLTTTNIDSSKFTLVWADAYAEEQIVLAEISDLLNELSARAEKQADAAAKAAQVAKVAADTAKELTKKASEKAAQSMQNVSKAGDDNFISAAEKSQMEIDWIALRDSSDSIFAQVEKSAYKQLITELPLLKNKITGADKGSLFHYLNSDDTKFFIINATEDEEVIVSEEDPSQPGVIIDVKKIVKVMGSKLKKDIDNDSEDGGKRFTRIWQEAYDARQTVMNQITKVSEDKLGEAQDQAILSMYGKYDPFFKQHVNFQEDYATLHVYSEYSDGYGHDISSIYNKEGFYMIKAGEFNGNYVLRTNGAKTIYWKNTVEVSDDIHYKIKMRTKSGNVPIEVTAGVICLDGNYAQISKISMPLKMTGDTWETRQAFFTKFNSEDSNYVMPNGTMHVRPFLSVPSAGRSQYTLFQSLEFVDGQDEVNQKNINAMFDDDMITADEKKSLNRTYQEIKVEKNKIDEIAKLPTFLNRLDMDLPSKPEESRALSKYNAAYLNIVKMFDGILDPSLPDVIQLKIDDRIKLNRVTSEYYSTKDGLQARMAVVAREVATEDAGSYTDQKAEFIKGLIDEGYIVLSDHTICLASFVIQSGGAKDDKGRPIWTPNSDFTQISGGKIEYFRSTKEGRKALITTMGPFVRGKAIMESNPGHVYPFHKIVDFPYLKPNLTTVLPSVKKFSLTSNVREVDVVAEKIAGGHNSWLFSIQATEEQYSVDVGRPIAGSRTVFRDVYGIDVRELTVKFPSVHFNRIGSWSNGGGIDRDFNKGAVFEILISIEDSKGKNVYGKTEIEIFGQGNATGNDRDTDQWTVSKDIYVNVNGAILKTNKKDDKVLTIELRKKPGIQLNYRDRDCAWSEYCFRDTRRSSATAKHSHEAYSLDTAALTNAAIWGGSVTTYSERIIPVVAGGEISYIAYEESEQKEMTKHEMLVSTSKGESND